MPQPYDYSTQQVDVGNYFDALKSGREEKAQMDAANRQSALQKYMPGALNGDAEARTQVMANANPDQQIALQNRFDNEPLQKIEQAMKMNGAITQLLSQVRDGDQQGFEAAKARAAQIGIPMDQMGHLTVADLPRLRAESGQTARELDLQYKQAQIRAQNANTAQSYAAADASRRAGREFEGRPKPLPQAAQRVENQWIEQTQVAANNVSDVTSYIDKIDAGQFDPGLLKNKYDQAKSFFGVVDPNDSNAINYNNFMADMNRLRNESLRLNVGPQTDQDAERAWDELFDNINDKTIVRSRLKTIAEINKRAVRQKAAIIQNQRKNYFGPDADAPDWQSFGVDPSILGQPAPTAPAAGGASAAPQPPANGGFTVRKVR